MFISTAKVETSLIACLPFHWQELFAWKRISIEIVLNFHLLESNDTARAKENLRAYSAQLDKRSFPRLVCYKIS
jgi:hypothetical protein